MHARTHTHTPTHTQGHTQTHTHRDTRAHTQHERSSVQVHSSTRTTPDLYGHVGREYGNPGNPSSRVVSDLCGPITQVIHLITGEEAESIVGAAVVNE